MTAVPQPSGTVTLVFTDIEGSTRLLDELGTDAYRDALAEHRRIVRDACARYEGYEVDYEGDAFFYAFATAQAAVAAVSEAMSGLDGGPIRIRVGIHTGDPALDPPKYVGIDVHRAARIMSAAHGGQVVLSPTTVSLLEPGTAATQRTRPPPAQGPLRPASPSPNSNSTDNNRVSPAQDPLPHQPSQCRRPRFVVARRSRRGRRARHTLTSAL